MIELQEAGGVYMVVNGTGGRVVEAVVCEVCPRNVSVVEPPCLTAFIYVHEDQLTCVLSFDLYHPGRFYPRASLSPHRKDRFFPETFQLSFLTIAPGAKTAPSGRLGLRENPLEALATARPPLSAYQGSAVSALHPFARMAYHT